MPSISFNVKKMKLPDLTVGVSSPGCFVGSGTPPKQKFLRIHPRACARGFLRRGIPVIIILALLMFQSIPTLAQTIVPPERPLSTRPKTVPGSIIVQFKDNPQFEYESKQEITIPLIGQKIEIRKEGFASKKFSTVTTITKDAKVEKVREIYEKLPQAPQKDKAYVLTTKTELTEQTITKLKNDPNVVLAQPNYVYETTFVPNDPYFSQIPLSYYQWNLVRINAPLAWDITKGNSNIKVAIIDTGVAFEDYTETLDGTQYTYHKAPELGNVNIAAKYRHISYRCGAYTCNPLPTPIIDNHANDRQGHGTHVAGTILQTMNNNSHATGIAPNVSLIPIAAESLGEGGFVTEDLLAALQFTKDNGAHVVNMSLGGPDFDEVENQKIQELISAGIIVVAAAGNDGKRTSSPSIGFPAGFPNVIAVGATRWDNIRANYSQYGTPTNGHNVTIMAPGGQSINDESTNFLDQNNDKLPDGIVQQTILKNQPSIFTQIDETINPTWGKKCISGTTYGSINPSCGLFNGTSMATPHVTAAVALIKSVNINLTPIQVQQILTQTANKTAIPSYNQNEYGAGLLDLHAAVIAAGGNPTPTPTSTPSPTSTPIPTSTPTFTPTPTPPTTLYQKGWNKIIQSGQTIPNSGCPSTSQRISRWDPLRLNFTTTKVTGSLANFLNCR